MEGTSKVGQSKPLTNKVMKVSIVIKNDGAIISRACQPSISAIVAGERVVKYWHILGMLNQLSRNSAPASDDQ